MSMRALLLAVRDQIRNNPDLNLDATHCDLMPDGRPPPMCGESFLSIWFGSVSSQSDVSLDEVYGINLTFSVRLPKVPYDRIGAEVIAKATDGVMVKCEGIRAMMHMDPNKYAILAAANEYINSPALGFVVPLKLQNWGRPEIREGHWFWTRGEPLAGIAQTMIYGGAQRIQHIEAEA